MTPSFYSSIELTEKEIEDAIKEAKIKKFFHVRNYPYWKKCDPDLKEKDSQSVGQETKV